MGFFDIGVEIRQPAFDGIGNFLGLGFVIDEPLGNRFLDRFRAPRDNFFCVGRNVPGQPIGGFSFGGFELSRRRRLSADRSADNGW